MNSMKHRALILATLLSLLIPVQSWSEETKSCPRCDDVRERTAELNTTGVVTLKIA